MADLDPARVEEIQWCECPPGPHYGAQLAGTTPLCQRCRRIPNEPWMHAALLAALVRAGVVTRETEQAWMPGAGGPTVRRYVTRWEDADE